MRHFITTAILLAAASAQAATLTVTIDRVRQAEGTMMIKLVDSADAYDGKAKQLAGHKLEISKTGVMSVEFPDLKPGTYSVMIMHDENNNGKLDSNILGIPKEGYGFSNNPRVMRQPTFDETKFEVKDADQTIVIDLI